MTECERLLRFFEMNQSKATLNECLRAGFYKLTARVSDLRKHGHTIVCIQNHKNPGENLYQLNRPKLAAVKIEEENSQLRFA